MSAKPDQSRLAKARYLRLLGVDSESALFDGIVSQIRAALGARAGEIPVRLSDAAPAFGIAARPEFDLDRGDGELVYRREQGRFVIRLNRGFQAWAQRASRRLDAGDQAALQGLGRSRFVYAHEFCHRFFFVVNGDSWERALGRSVESMPEGASQTEALRALRGLEERLCSKAAGELLVPSDSLKSLVSTRLAAEEQGSWTSLYETLKDVQRSFGVSLDCALVRLEQAMRSMGVVRPPDGVCLLIDWTDRKGTVDRGSVGRSRDAYRIRMAVFPRQLGQVAIEGLFPGIAAKNLGQEFEAFVKAAVGSASVTTEPRPLDVQIVVQEAGSSVEHKKSEARLRGSWLGLPKGPERSSSRRLLLWGRLAAAGTAL